MSDVLDKARSLKLTLELAADKLDEHFTNVRIARIVGSSVGASCAVVTIGSGIAIPFTLGISLVPLILSIVFASVGTVGSVTAGGASITGHIIEKKKLAEMNTQWEQFRKECSDIFGLKSKKEDMNKIARIQEVFKELTAGGVFVGRQVYAMMGAAKTVSQATAQTAVAGVTNAAETASLVGVTAAVETAATAGVAGASVTSSGATSATTGAASAAVASVTKCAATATKTGISSGATVAAVAKTATTTAKTATTGAATTARLVAAVQAPIVVVNVFLLGLSIHDLVTASIDLHKKNKSKAGDMLRQMAAELDVFFKEDVPTVEQVEECLAFGG